MPISFSESGAPNFCIRSKIAPVASGAFMARAIRLIASGAAATL